MDDAGGGKRGLRAQSSAELLDALEHCYGIVPSGPPIDLGGSSNLNLLIVDSGRRVVARVYRQSVSGQRLSDIQQARRQLADHGFPCPVPIAALDGKEWTLIDGRLVEVEEYVDHDSHMDTWDRVLPGLRTLGGMHEVLKVVTASPDGRAPRFVNYIDPAEVLEASARGVARIRSWSPTLTEAQLADASEELARLVSDAQSASNYAALPRQLVHGDFWDNNVLYREDRMVLIHDFDHMGERARIDDLALTLYYMNLEPAADLGMDRRRSLVRHAVDSYDSGVEVKLSSVERAALPLALSRQPLWSIGGWIVELDDENAARAHAAGMTTAVEFAVGIMLSLLEWQDALA